MALIRMLLTIPRELVVETQTPYGMKLLLVQEGLWPVHAEQTRWTMDVTNPGGYVVELTVEVPQHA